MTQSPLSDEQYRCLKCLKRWIRSVNQALVSMTGSGLREIYLSPELYPVFLERRERDIRRFGWRMYHELTWLGIPIRPGMRFRMVA